ncbi:hypothetical protein [Capnocytophaga cynodegmi]|uniref:Uncharacterized protein n=1 Tax=Capnocytophaga cynodegmi TaxID=28189 RepID=A0A0B7HRR6_9FLAO|nr:hypothetical protein [Capnocytophaga cynodegmi]CEN40602.1 hypothetical protein CCYN74_430039 [Capnocytophaga cynodegmi]
MKHLEFYAQKLQKSLEEIKGVSNVLNYNTSTTINFSFWFENYEVFNEIDKQLPKDWYVSFLQRDKIAVLKYYISEEQQQYLTDEYLMSLNAK